MKLQGKVALITGAARGIGRAHAHRLARLGADLVINDINLESFKEFDDDDQKENVVDEVRKMGIDAVGIECHAGKKDQADDLVKKAVARFGKVDILINNAGGLAGDMNQSFAASVSEEDLQSTLDRNLMSAIFCSQAVSESMKKNNWGRIVNTASQAGLQAQKNGIYASYGVAKAGIIHYTRYLAQELGRYNITVNCMAPAYISTPRLDKNVYSKMKDPARQYGIPLGRLATPDDVAKVVEFFVTDLGDYITGQCLSVCGGALKF
ncbi:MAG: SDR family oxidoreductase [Desulfobacteraceae bacterium]|nr:SDR family oxidoreductase [Desulfobacteraceae bacterium]MBU4000708.1 SDR family oxidoreductase [Pseudomonadota bacterium]MBU4053336.1 SDR family oxidoreductase [Pseudomonadota bacterium]